MKQFANKSFGKVIKNILWLIFDKVFILVMNLVVLFVVANYYGKQLYGVFQYATNIVLILEVIVQLIDSRVVKKKYINDNYDEIVFNVTISKVFLSTVALIIGTFILFFSKRGNDFSFIFIFLLVDSIFKNLRFGMENRFEYFLKSKKVVIASNIGLLIGTILQLVIVYRDGSIRYIAVVQAIASIVSLTILYIQYRCEYKISNYFRIKKELIADIVKESLPLAIATAACVIYTRCDSVMLGMMLSPAEVGIYSISSKFISTIQMLIVPIQTTIFVKMLEWNSDREKYEKFYLKITSIITWLSILGILISFVILPYVFKLLKPEYLPAMESYKILSISTIFAYNACLRSSHFTITNNGKILMVSQVVTVVINVILNYVFIKTMGMNGAALATVCAQVLSLFVSNAFFKDARFVLKNQVKAFCPIYIFK